MTRDEIKRRRVEHLESHPGASIIAQDKAAEWPVPDWEKVVRNYIARFPDVSVEELTELAVWVAGGNDPFDNPYDYCGDDCWPLDFINAYRELPF